MNDRGGLSFSTKKMKIFLILFLIVCSAAIAADSVIDQLAARLEKDPMWENGLFPKVDLSATATPIEVIRERFRIVTAESKRFTEFRIEEARTVRIHSANYTALRMRTQVGEKIALLKYCGAKVGWWTRIFDEEK
jgi:hypothetical protein